MFGHQKYLLAFIHMLHGKIVVTFYGCVCCTDLNIQRFGVFIRCFVSIKTKHISAPTLDECFRIF